MRFGVIILTLALAARAPGLSQTQDAGPVAPANPAPSPAAAPAAPAASPAPAPGPAMRSVDDAAARRNENVQVNRIDNDGVKEANIRLGDTATLITLPRAERTYFAAEHGRAPGTFVVPGFGRPAGLRQWHADLFAFHQNSVFNARTFFQAGPVQPSRQNQYGFTASGTVTPLGLLTLSLTNRKVRGMVNGNVLVPLASERTARAADPARRAIIQSLLDLYPRELPNRPDFDPRALNTNAPQNIDELDHTIRLDRAAGRQSALSASWTSSRQRIDAFQLVPGQNPDTEVHSHRATLGWRTVLGSHTDFTAGIQFQRVMSDLRPEPNAAPFRVRLGYAIEELGPDAQFPIHRALNTYRTGWLATHRGPGRHTLTFGASAVRTQLNGIETNNSRGYFAFTSAFGRGSLDNFLLGIPTQYEVSLGEMSRAFRAWSADFFAADQWRISPRVDLYFGLRYSPQFTPTEARGLSSIPYSCDCNNWSPRLGLALRLTDAWVARLSYQTAFAEILPVTYQQARYNLPQVRYVQVQNPDLLHPLAAASPSRTVPVIFSPDLVAPYSHQYGLSLERPLGRNAVLRFAYIGSQTTKLLNYILENRGRQVPGIEPALNNIDLRRPNQAFYDINHIVNGGRAWYDAAQAGFDWRRRGGVAWGATYTFSKAIDEGADYTSTAANRDLARNRHQTERDGWIDRKGLSNFDSTHTLMVYATWDLPGVGARSGTLAWLTSGWQVSTTVLARSGTPFTLYVGSDAPGFGNVDGSSGDRPSIVDPSILGMTIDNPDTAPLIISRDRFRYIGLGEARGNLGRGTFRKDAIANVNAALSREWRLPHAGERKLVFRGEAFNFTNHPQFDEPQRNLSSPAFGRLTNTLNDGRVLQLGLKLVL